MSGKYNSGFNNKWSTDFVDVHLNFTNNSTGKKMFDWQLSVAGKHERIPVEVKAFNNGTDMWFEATAQCLPRAIKSTDINRLKDEVMARVTEQVTLLTNIEWEEWYEVVVTGANSDFSDSRYSALGADLKIQVNSLKRGVDPSTGRALTIINGSVTAFPEPSRITDDEETVSGYVTGSRAEKSYIPATPENRAAIDNILSKMQELRYSIADLLSQENVAESLVSDTVRLLPRP